MGFLAFLILFHGILCFGDKEGLENNVIIRVDSARVARSGIANGVLGIDTGENPSRVFARFSAFSMPFLYYVALWDTKGS